MSDELRELRDSFADLLRHHTRAAHALHGDDRPDYPEEECWATGRRASAALRRFDALLAAPSSVREEGDGDQLVIRMPFAEAESLLEAWQGNDDAICSDLTSQAMARVDDAVKAATEEAPDVV